mgnify:CR=1 FL=1
MGKNIVYRDKAPKAKHTDSTHLKAAISSGLLDILIAFFTELLARTKTKRSFLWCLAIVHSKYTYLNTHV